VVEICRGSGASMSVPREVTGPRPITMLKPMERFRGYSPPPPGLVSDCTCGFGSDD
jgi:hypothetical protein